MNLASMPVRFIEGYEKSFLDKKTGQPVTFYRGVFKQDNERSVELTVDPSVSFSFLGFDQELSLFNSSFLVQAVVFFRPFIRGFIVLLWCFFAVNQVLSILGHQEIVGRGQVPGQMRMDI